MPRPVGLRPGGQRTALLVAVEKYQSSQIKPVQFAQADAAALSDALRRLGFDQVEVLHDQAATKTSVESHFRRTVQGLQASDEFVFFFAGHGFSENDRNYLLAHDTQPGDLGQTSVALQDLFAGVRASQVNRAIFFLDACQTGVPIDQQARGVITTLTPEELEAFFRDAEYYMCFASCKQDQSSYSSRKLQHGIWTYHLVQSLTGNEPSILHSGGILTAGALQDHLAVAVPRTLRETFTSQHAQTPWAYGGQSSEFVVADLTDMLARREAEASRGSLDYMAVVLRGSEAWRVKELSGYRRHWHHVPVSVDDASRRFVIGVATDDLRRRVDAVYEKIQGHLGYTRRDVLSNVDEARGVASLTTPDFEFSITVGIDEEDPTRVLWSFQVGPFARPEVVHEEAFQQVFGSMFEEVDIPSANPLDVEAVIDRLESMGLKNIRVRYPRDFSSCTISIEGYREDITVGWEGVRIQAPGARGVVALLERAESVHQAFLESGKTDLLQIGSGE